MPAEDRTVATEEAVMAAAETKREVIARRPPPKPTAKKAFTAKTLIGVLVGVLIGGGVGFGIGKYGSGLLVPFEGAKWLKLVALLGLPVWWFVAVGVHELGHVVGGWIGGGRLLLYVVGPFMWRRTPAGLQFGWNRQVNLAGGLAACLPLDPGAVSASRFAVMIAGGPVSSLLLAAMLGGVAGLLSVGEPGAARALLQHQMAFGAAISLLIFAVTALPGAAGGFKSDGRRFLELLRGDARSEQEKAMIVLTVSSLGGVRPADYDPALIARVTALRDGSLFDLYGHYSAFHHAMDGGEPARGQAALDHVLSGEEKLAPFLRDAVRCDYAWLLARHTADASAARAWLDSAGTLAFDPATRLRAEAAVLLAEGRKSEAAAKAREGLVALETKSLTPVKNAFAAEVLEEILREASEAEDSRPS
jgi:hypothetical protein